MALPFLLFAALATGALGQAVRGNGSDEIWFGAWFGLCVVGALGSVLVARPGSRVETAILGPSFVVFFVGPEADAALGGLGRHLMVVAYALALAPALVYLGSGLRDQAPSGPADQSAPAPMAQATPVPPNPQ